MDGCWYAFMGQSPIDLRVAFPGIKGPSRANLFLSRSSTGFLYRCRNSKIRFVAYGWVQALRNPEEPFCQSDVVFLCVYDYQAVKELLHAIENIHVLSCKILVNFTTGTTEDAVIMESQLAVHFGVYINDRPDHLLHESGGSW